jgi:argininosuccinate synthase
MAAIVVAYSGDPARDAGIVSRLALDNDRRAEVVTLTLDLGQRLSLEGIRSQALAEGAVRAHVIDGRDELARDFVVPALQAGALGADCAPRLRGLAHALIAKRLVEIARIESASAIAHGATDTEAIEQFAQLVRSLGWTQDVIAAASSPATIPGAEAPRLHSEGNSGTSSQRLVSIEVTFERGVPIAVNGVDMPLVDLIQSLEIIAHAPAVIALDLAHAELRRRTQSGEGAAGETAQKVSKLITTGRWFSAARRSLQARVDRIEASVSGAVRLSIENGICRVDEARSLA